jgi:hypothetical protein
MSNCQIELLIVPFMMKMAFLKMYTLSPRYSNFNLIEIDYSSIGLNYDRVICIKLMIRVTEDCKEIITLYFAALRKKIGTIPELYESMFMTVNVTF